MLKPFCRYVLVPASLGKPAVYCGQPVRFKIIKDDDGNSIRRYETFCDEHVKLKSEDEEEENPLDLGTPWLWLAALGVALYNKSKKQKEPISGLNMGSYNTTCPVCNQPATSSCRCFIGEVWCNNKHAWIRCPIHGTRIVVTGINVHKVVGVRARPVGVGLSRSDCWCYLKHRFTSGRCPPLTHCTDRLGEIEEKTFAAPIKGSPIITSLFGEKRVRKALSLNYQHKGLDLAAKIGTPVYAIYKGNVALAHEVTGFGNCVVLKSIDPNNVQFRSVYAHLTDIKVKPGQKVSTGQLIGTVGITGRVLGKGGPGSAHLHFELLNGWTSPLAPPSERLDPLAFLQERGITPGRIT